MASVRQPLDGGKVALWGRLWLACRKSGRRKWIRVAWWSRYDPEGLMLEVRGASRSEDVGTRWKPLMELENQTSFAVAISLCCCGAGRPCDSQLPDWTNSELWSVIAEPGILLAAKSAVDGRLFDSGYSPEVLAGAARLSLFNPLLLVPISAPRPLPPFPLVPIRPAQLLASTQQIVPYQIGAALISSSTLTSTP
ncbi:hypothetical protein BDN71DRAFT_1429770 [Pleurotus eryngii]|uniref:Uncharacterized protein n=1 Tax=Pleurotus eryngii TaxID=5323 RepID=A0A9P6DA91_PLEER|nr:hypothetical protein BDN71DRAFT_1429770 [Pleurotus eryngii]